MVPEGGQPGAARTIGSSRPARSRHAAAAGRGGPPHGEVAAHRHDVWTLAPAFRAAVETLQPGQVSAPIRTAAGLHVLAVCAKRSGGAEALSTEQIESRLFGQQLSMIARRYMRDLRTSATIETR